MAKRTKAAKRKRPPSISFLQREPSALFCLFFLLVIVTLLYWGTLDNPLVFDSASQFSDRKLENDFTNFTLFGLRSLPYLTFGIFYQFIGKDWFWHRIPNILLHGVNAFLLFVFLKALFGRILAGVREKAGVHPGWIAFCGALIFAVHPISVYATAYLIQRSILMGTAFGLISLICYFHGVVNRRWWWFLLSVLFYFFSMHSKEHCVMLPAMAFVMTFLLESFSLKGYLKRYGWVYLLFAIIALQAVFRVKGIFAEVYEPHGLDMINNARKSQSLISENDVYALSIMTQGYMFFRYLFLWIFPLPHWIYIDIHLPFPTGFLHWPETLGFAGFIFYFIIAVRLLFKKDFLALAGFGLLSTGLLFMTEMSAVRLSEQFVLYRSYFWAIGLFAVLPLCFSLWMKCFRRAEVLLLIVGLYLVALVIITHNRLQTFDSEIALWQDVVDKVERDSDAVLYKNYRPFNNLANKLVANGRFEEALPYYMIGLDLNPNEGLARANLAIMFFKQTRYAEAIRYYEEAIDLDPGFLLSYIGLGMCYYSQGDYLESLVHYNRALKIDPDYTEAHYNLGNSYFKMRRFADAVRQYEKTVALNPHDIDVFYNLALAYAETGRDSDAVRAFQSLLERHPNHKRRADALFEMANAYFRQGKYNDAIDAYQKVAEERPDLVDAYYNSGICHMKLKEFAQAMKWFNQALEVKPGHQKSIKALSDIKKLIH